MTDREGVMAGTSGEPRIALLRDETAERYDFGRDHPLAPVRVELTHALIETSGLADLARVVRPHVPPFDPDALGHVHTADYVAAVRRLSDALLDPGARGGDRAALGAAAYGLGEGDTPAFGGMHEASLAVVGASVEAARQVLEGRVLHAFNPGGGLHHAMPGRAAGFCIYNDPALAIDWLLRNGVERVAYIDVDVHHGDGVERAFVDDPRVLTISLHESGRYLFPGTGEPDDIGGEGARGSVVNVPLAPQTAGAVWLDAFDAVVEPLVRAFTPDVLVTQLGCDTHATDPLAHLALTLDDLAAIYRRLHALAHETAEGRWVATGGGGYQLVSVVPLAWTLAFAEMVGMPAPIETPMQWRELVVTRLGMSPPRSFDDVAPQLAEGALEQARAFADEAVTAVRRLVFPRHGLRPGGSAR
jgi:acetoin utilization protein AcuC